MEEEDVYEVHNHYDDTVFIQFEHENLKYALDCWVLQNNCGIICGRPPDAPDIIMIPYFVCVVDREYMGKIWGDFVDYLEQLHRANEEFGEVDVITEKIYNYRPREACIIIDNRKDLPLPKLDNVFLINPNEKNGIEWIVSIIDLAYKNIFKKD